MRTDAAETEIRRRRECLRCKHRWTTLERTAEDVEKLERIRETVRPLAHLLG